MINTAQEKFTLKPLSPQYFVGRREQVYRILHNGLIARTPNLLNLRGPQRIGRTSLLYFTQALARTNGANTDYASIFKESTNKVKLSCPYIDLRVLSSGQPEVVKTTFIEVLAQSLYDQSSGDISEKTLYGLVEAMASHSQYHFILLIDRAEHLLDQRIQATINDILGVLNDAVPNLGILLSFGASGELSAQDVISRTAEIDQSIASISSLMNLVRYDIDIGLLQPDEAEQFLTEPAPAPFSKEEVNWILDKAGTHPYLLNLVSILILEEKQYSPNSLTRAELSIVENKALNQLKPRISNIWKRLSDLKDYKALDLALTLASSPLYAIPIMEVSEELVRILEGEGLVQKSDSDWVMLSGLFRKLLLEHAEKGNIPVANSDSMHVSGNTLIIRVDGISYSITLTEIETKIMEMLLNAGPDQLVTNEDLLRIWPPSGKELNDQQKLSQRLKALRNKLKPILNENPIENVYGVGYRLKYPK